MMRLGELPFYWRNENNVFERFLYTAFESISGTIKNIKDKILKYCNAVLKLFWFEGGLLELRFSKGALP